jgi:tRNA nucleotidyltransferase (CCA-adding enzyme)
MNTIDMLDLIAEKVDKVGGKTLLVGGCVRDSLLGIQPKDFDVEVYGIPFNNLEKLLQSIPEVQKVNKVGESFCVLKVGQDIDISVPRKDRKIGEGHKGFEVEEDPFADYKDAFRRRDFTINAIGYNLITKCYIDCFGGVDDLQDRILRIVDKKTFQEDPLRVFRALQFVARFDLKVAADTEHLLIAMRTQLDELPKERVLEEFSKLFLKGCPSVGLELGRQIGCFRNFPYLDKLQNINQDPIHHPEGDVWKHTLQCVDFIAGMTLLLSDDERFMLILAALCHDFGKIETTEENDGKITSYQHDKVGEQMSIEFLQALGVDNYCLERIPMLVKEHMFFRKFRVIKEKLDGQKAVRRLAIRLYPATIEQLVTLMRADRMNRNNEENIQQIEKLLEVSKDLGVEKSKPEDFVTGKELIRLGFEPGKQFGVLISKCNEMRDEGVSKEDAYVWLLLNKET